MSPMLSSAGDRVDATAILFLAMDNAKSTDLHTQLPVLPKYAIIGIMTSALWSGGLQVERSARSICHVDDRITVGPKRSNVILVHDWGCRSVTPHLEIQGPS